jgi:crotonobetaine/carnitine-CoA ligase
MGYWRNAEATVNTWRNLWFHTGDYLRRDAEGWFEFIDRKKDAMRRFGENISSFEVESALLSHDAVEEVAVYAVPANLSEDEVMATILRPDARRRGRPPPHCVSSSLLAVPRYTASSAELPHPTAKVQKSELRQLGRRAHWTRSRAADQARAEGHPRGMLPRNRRIARPIGRVVRSWSRIFRVMRFFPNRP